MSDEELVDIIELDRLTGNERLIPMASARPRSEAEREVANRERIITGRHGYRLVPTGTWEDR